MTIRPLVATDLPLIRSWMQRAPGAPRWSDSDLAGLVASEPGRLLRKGWLAFDASSEPQGFLTMSALCVPGVPAECEIEFVMTAPRYWRQGVARALVAKALEWSRELAAKELRLEVRASNEAAQRLYERCGFQHEGRRSGYYSGPTEDAVLMRLRIDSEGGAGLV
jgi:ribosomal-protein-alanine N-acetyltransferase